MTKATDGFTIKSHFEGKDASVRQVYERLLKSARKFGAVGEEPKKTSIHLINRTAFAGVTMRKSAIILTIKSDQSLKSAHTQIRTDLGQPVSSPSQTRFAG